MLLIKSFVVRRKQKNTKSCHGHDEWTMLCPINEKYVCLSFRQRPGTFSCVYLFISFPVNFQFPWPKFLTAQRWAPYFVLSVVFFWQTLYLTVYNNNDDDNSSLIATNPTPKTFSPDATDETDELPKQNSTFYSRAQMFLKLFLSIGIEKKSLSVSRAKKKNNIRRKVSFQRPKKDANCPPIIIIICFFFFFFFLPCWLVSFKSIYGSTRVSDALALACSEK